MTSKSYAFSLYSTFSRNVKDSALHSVLTVPMRLKVELQLSAHILSVHSSGQTVFANGGDGDSLGIGGEYGVFVVRSRNLEIRRRSNNTEWIGKVP